jgi:uncharacterized protein YjiK
VAAVIGYGVAVAMHWDDRGVLWVKESFESPAERQRKRLAAGLPVVIDAKPLPGMDDDEASDLAYNPQTKTLFSVMGKNPFLVELSLQGDVLRKMPLVGWSNPEGVAVLEDGLLAIVDERNHDLTIVKVDARPRAEHRRLPELRPGRRKTRTRLRGGHLGPARQRLMLGEERPPALFTWKSDGAARSRATSSAASDELDMRNLSALAIDPRTGHMLVLSADSNLLLELDEKGEQVSFMTLLGGFNGLEDTIPRAEGVAMDDKGTCTWSASQPVLSLQERTDNIIRFA